MRSFLAAVYFISLSALVLSAANDTLDGSGGFIPGFNTKNSSKHNDLFSDSGDTNLTKPAFPRGSTDEDPLKNDSSTKKDDSTKDSPLNGKKDATKKEPSKDDSAKDSPLDNKMDSPLNDKKDATGKDPLKDDASKDSPLDDKKDATGKDPLKDDASKDSPLEDKKNPTEEDKSTSKVPPKKDGPIILPIDDSAPKKDTTETHNDRKNTDKKPKHSDCNKKKCTDGAFVCNGKDFKKCDHGAWVLFNCAPGTACNSVGKGVIICDYPQSQEKPITIQPVPSNKVDTIKQVVDTSAYILSPEGTSADPPASNTKEDDSEWEKGIKLNP